MKGLVKAINKLAEAIITAKINSPWLNQKQAAAYLRMSVNSFKDIEFKSHSLYEEGKAIERWNRNELDQEMLKR